MDPQRHRHRRNPSKHSILANIPDLMNKESAPKAFRFPRASSKTREVPIVEKEAEYEGKENFGERKSARPEKRVTWSKDLLQVRSISPRQKQIQHRMASPRSSRINTTISSPSLPHSRPISPPLPLIPRPSQITWGPLVVWAPWGRTVATSCAREWVGVAAR